MKIKPIIFCLLVILFINNSETGDASSRKRSKSIRIGATVSRSGKYREPSEMIEKGYLLWQKEVNQRGGILGRKVELILKDDKSKRQLVRKYYKKFIVQDKVDLVFSPYGTPLTLEASRITERYGYPLLACSGASDIIWNRGYKYIFGMYAVARRYFIGLLDIMARKGYKQVALVYSNNSPFHFDIAKGVNEWSKRFGIKIVYEKVFSKKEDLLSISKELKRKKIKSIIISAYSPNLYALLKAMENIDYKPPIIGMPIAPIHPGFWEKAGIMAPNVFAPSQWEPNERIPFPGTKQFIKSFIKSYGKIPSYHAGSAYSACQIFEVAIKNSKSINRKLVRDYIASLDTVTVIGRYKVDFSGKQIGHNTIMIQWQNGKKEIVWPTKMQTKPPIL